MYKIARLDTIPQAGLDRFTEAYQVTDVVDTLEGADGALIRSRSVLTWEIPDRLLAMARSGAGTNNVPVAAMSAKGQVVLNAPGGNANAVKELVLCAIIDAWRNYSKAVEWGKTLDGNVTKGMEGGKGQFNGRELFGSTLGVVGLGAVGGRVANAAAALGMHVIGYDPYITEEHRQVVCGDVEWVTDVTELYRRADAVSLHIPAETRNLKFVGAEAFDAMKENVLLVNFARDLVVDEKALLTALESGKVYRYVTDFINETVQGKVGVIASPHIGASTDLAGINCATMVAEEMMDYLENGNIINGVNFPKVNLGKRAGMRVLLRAAGPDSGDLEKKAAAALPAAGLAVTAQAAGTLDAVTGKTAAFLADVAAAAAAKDAPTGAELEARLAAATGACRVRVLL